MKEFVSALGERALHDFEFATATEKIAPTFKVINTTLLKPSHVSSHVRVRCIDNLNKTRF